MSKEPSSVVLANPEAYYPDIGRFVMVYGMAEAVLKYVLNSKAGLDRKMALALLSGVRADAACSLLRRCYAAKGEDVSPELDRLLSQFQVLTNFRNDLLHHGIDFSTDPPLSSNRENVLHVSAVREHVIERDTLARASMDCSRFVLGMSMIFVEPHPEDQRGGAEETLTFAANRPWNYKSPAPANKGRSDRPKSEPHRSKRRQQPPSE